MNDFGQSPRQKAVTGILQKIRTTVNGLQVGEIDSTVQHSIHSLGQPMRVAIIGIIKAGKSTMMNALLGENAVPVGSLEATFNVNEFNYGENPGIEVHFKDKHKRSEKMSFERLEEVTLRRDKNAAFLRSINYIEVTHPSPLLKSCRLIDTPGLWSHYDVDSKNTLDRIGLTGDDLTKRSCEETSNADAVLYSFPHGLSAQDQKVMEEFLGKLGGSATPFNAMGVLTKIDTMWPEVDNPLAKAREIADGYMTRAIVNSLFYSIHPISGKLAVGARTFTDEEFQNLLDLARTPWETLNVYLQKTYERIATADSPAIKLPAPQRKALLDRFDRYGIWLACQSIQEHGISDRQLLTAHLLEASGFNDLLRTVTCHFGNRAFLIKLGRSLQNIKSACIRARSSNENVADVALGQCEEIELEELGLRELDVLRSFYNRKLALTEMEVTWLLQATGENGPGFRQRLGLAPDAPISRIVEVASERAAHWRCKGDNFLCSREERSAAATVTRCYESIRHRAQIALGLAVQIEELLGE